MTDESPVRRNTVRFLKRSHLRRVAVCTVCKSLVALLDIEAHARYHVNYGQGQVKYPGLHAAYNDVTVYNDHTTKTGWVTESTGPS